MLEILEANLMCLIMSNPSSITKSSPPQFLEGILSDKLFHRTCIQTRVLLSALSLINFELPSQGVLQFRRLSE